MIALAAEAAAAMLVQDVMAVLLVQAEARNKALLSAVLDAVMWPAAMWCTTISVTALQGHQLGDKAAVIAAVEMANVAGSFIAVGIGKRYIRERKEVKGCTGCCTCSGSIPSTATTTTSGPAPRPS